MNTNKDRLLKYITIGFFLGFIFLFPIINIFTPDKNISEIENKLLTKLPKPSLEKIYNGSFMRNFDEYASDQFPFRPDFIKIKNMSSYFIGSREFRNIYVGEDGRLLEKFIFNKDIIDKNISQVTKLSSYLSMEHNISSTVMIVPTSIAFYEEQLPDYAITDKQTDVLTFIEKSLSNNFDKPSGLKFYTPYNILSNNKNKYIYFNTDHHWTQLGAKLAYDDLYRNNSNISYNFNNDSKYYKKVTDDFYGTYYSKALLPQIKGDSIYAYENYNNFNIEIDFSKRFDSLYDKNKLNSKNKYQYFLHGDPAFAVVTGNPKADNEILIFKDSYAHSFIPFLTQNYSKIHIVDPRYYNLNIEDYLKKNNNIKHALFLYNISTFNGSILHK